MSELKIRCGNPLNLEDILRLLVRDTDCQPYSTCESESIESIIKRLVSDAGDGYLSLNICFAPDLIGLVPQGSAPSNPTEGMIYANTNHHLYYWNGSTWKQLDN